MNILYAAITDRKLNVSNLFGFQQSFRNIGSYTFSSSETFGQPFLTAAAQGCQMVLFSNQKSQLG
jgi:hypothetical protein